MCLVLYDKTYGGLTVVPAMPRNKSEKILGPEWTESDLHRFFELFKLHGHDWDKIAASMRGRTSAMLRALHSINKGFLSLPTASAIHFAAIMMDRYNSRGVSDSSSESLPPTPTRRRNTRRRRSNRTPSTGRTPKKSRRSSPSRALTGTPSVESSPGRRRKRQLFTESPNVCRLPLFPIALKCLLVHLSPARRS